VPSSATPLPVHTQLQASNSPVHPSLVCTSPIPVPYSFIKVRLQCSHPLC
jgi:hypothetical protein